ncbi:hypothetical protein J437_LFUL016911 [Ladona fulva]|uniref:Uncharacterized protein n=1 Tax=Ladona fulva TaxID=123851 RepID=A0A8K0KMQ0_LADFU|nr:hypothetical protein J437_LFUL016911 [Ladona fulva]
MGGRIQSASLIKISSTHKLKSIKYECKCANKGSDMAVFAITRENREQHPKHEILEYQMGGYINSDEEDMLRKNCKYSVNNREIKTEMPTPWRQSSKHQNNQEELWIMLGFPIHDRQPAVVHLTEHLHNGQRVYFTKETAERVGSEPP